MSNPVALISGASRGIGRATAIALATQGYHLALIARTASDLKETASQAGAPNALLLPIDVTNPDQVQHAIKKIIDHFGHLDALINVAGLAPAKSIEAMTVEEWRNVLDTNLSSAFYLTKFAWPYLKRRPFPNSGVGVPPAELISAKTIKAGGTPAPQTQLQSVIVNISSLSARDPFNGFAAYGAAKAALNIFSLVAAREGFADGIAVHTIAPGAVETAMFRQLMTPEQYPAEKTLAPQDVADIIVQCVTGRLRHASGEVIYLHKTP